VKINQLTAIKCKKLIKPGFYNDGLGLYLQVTPAGSKSWVYRYKRNGKSKKMGLGSFHTVSLSDARGLAKESRLAHERGVDPKECWDERKAENRCVIDFKSCAEKYIEFHKKGWKNAKHKDQWTNTLTTYVYPFIGNKSVKLIDTTSVLQCLEPIWYEKTETANRVRGRIENILNWAKARNYRTGENPACWRGHLDQLLPKRSKIQKVVHFSALPYKSLPEFYQSLCKHQTTKYLALRFIILTAARSSEARSASVEEFKNSIWTIPAERMKAGREHRVPLSPESLKVLNQAIRLNGEQPFKVSDTAVRLLIPDATIHGMRSCFRDWCAEQTNFPRECAESALAHVLKDKVEAAYQRGNMFEKRTLMMQQWANYLTKKQSNVVALHG
jgi:integrase